jgi:TRAP-type C4-dicarboxylate transport system permease small subunit
MFLPKAASWTEEVARYAFIYAVAAAGGLAARANSYVSVDILTNYIPKRLRRAYFIALDAFLCSFALFFLIKCAATDKFAFLKRRFVSTALEMPMQLFYFALVALFASLAFNYMLNIISLVKGEDKREPPPQ